MATAPQSRRLGATMMLVSGFGFGSTGAISRSIDADAWQMASWRALIGGTLALGYAWVRRRIGSGVDVGGRADARGGGDGRGPGEARPERGVRAAGRRPMDAVVVVQGALLVALSALSSFLYIDALQRTEVANVSVIIATIPFIAAALAWLILRERLRRATVIAALVSMTGVTITVAGNLGPGDLAGNVRAVLLALTLALLIVLIRRFGGADAVMAVGLSGIVLYVVALVVADPFGVDAGQAPLIGFFGLVFAVSLVLWTEGARLIPAAEAGLLGSSETPFSILLAWIVVAEAPPLVTVVGGLLVLGAVLCHAGADLANNRVSKPWTRPRARLRL